MGNTGGNSLRVIQQGFQETERLLNRRQYNLAMVKARQTLEFMVRYLGDRACIVDSDLMDTIDQLYEGHWISKSSQDHYHKIRIIGNKAVHDGDRNPNNASLACQLLSQEVQTFIQTYAHGKPRQGGARRTGRPAGATAHRRKKKPPMIYYLIKFLLPIVLVIILVSLVWALTRKHEKTPKQTEPETLTMAQTLPPETEYVPPTEPVTEPETAAPAVYKVAKNVNVRPQPSTEGTPLATIKAGTQVEFVREHDDKWSVIMYNGQEAYVSSEFLTKE